jgi:hypothetical protein
VVILDIVAMEMVNWKRDIFLSSNEMYERILNEDVVSFDVWIMN